MFMLNCFCQIQRQQSCFEDIKYYKWKSALTFGNEISLKNYSDQTDSILRASIALVTGMNHMLQYQTSKQQY